MLGANAECEPIYLARGHRILCGERGGYRLAKLSEYKTQPSLLAGDLNAPKGPFSGVQSAGYWSATTDADVPSNAWVVNVFNGTVIFLNMDNHLLHAWCVRGG